MQKLRQTKLQRFFNNMLTRREALGWAAFLIGVGIAIGLSLAP